MGKFEDSDVVALPYVGDRFVMFLIVPDQHRFEFLILLRNTYPGPWHNT